MLRDNHNSVPSQKFLVDTVECKVLAIIKSSQITEQIQYDISRTGLLESLTVIPETIQGTLIPGFIQLKSLDYLKCSIGVRYGKLHSNLASPSRNFCYLLCIFQLLKFVMQ